MIKYVYGTSQISYLVGISVQSINQSSRRLRYLCSLIRIALEARCVSVRIIITNRSQTNLGIQLGAVKRSKAVCVVLHDSRKKKKKLKGSIAALLDDARDGMEGR